MFQPATASSSDIAMKSLIVPVGDDTAVTVLNNDHKKDSEPNSDNAVDVLIVSRDIAPKTTILPVQHKGENISSKPIEVAAALDNESAMTAAGTGSDGNEVATFPQKLMEMINDSENAEIIAWLPHGRAFAIHRKREFATDVLPKYFPTTAKYSSFTRKVNRWRFIRVTRGPENGAYYHHLFRRNEPRLALKMTCHIATATNSDNIKPHVSTASPIVPKASKGLSGSSHAFESDAMAMMKMYPNYLDPLASPYLYPCAGLRPPQYPTMGPQPQQYYSNTMLPSNMYEEAPYNGMISDESQYYPPATGGLYSNHYPMPLPNGQSMDLYSQTPTYHNIIAKQIHNGRSMSPTYGDMSMTRQSHYHDDTVGPSRCMTGMSERFDHSSRTTSMFTTAADDEGELLTQAYTGDKNNAKDRTMLSLDLGVWYDDPIDHRHRRRRYPPG